MAVTIHQEPQLISPVNNFLTFTFSSNQTSQANFSYYVELYVNSSFHSAHTIFPENGIYAKFDVSQLLKPYCESLIPDGTIEVNYDATLAQYAIVVYEKYGTPPITQASATSSTLNAFNGSLRYPDFIQWDYLVYDPSSTQDSLFLTSFPRSQKTFVRDGESLYLGTFISTPMPAGTSTLIVELFDIAGNSIIYDTYPLAGGYTFGLYNVGPDAIIGNTTITQNDFDQCYRYYAQIDYAGVSYSEAFIIYYDHDCARYDVQRLHWLNKYGVWDSFSFKLLSQDSTNITAVNYNQMPGAWNDDQYQYALNNGDKRTLIKRAEDSLLLNSDWMTEAVQNWLVRELYESSVVYLDLGNNDLELLNITNTATVLKQKRKDGLIQEQVSADRTYISYSQLT
jgi:hypothetical protein